MIVDTSALISVFLSEPDASLYAGIMERAPLLRMGAPLYFEACIVAVSRNGPAALPKLELITQVSNIEIIPFTGAAARVAAEAFVKYGKGRHKAALNYADCMSYALAKTEMMP